MKTTPQSRIDQYTQKQWWGQTTLHGQLAHNAQQYPDRLAAADQPNKNALTGTSPLRLNFSELKNASDQLSIQLLQQGVGVDDVVIVQLPNIVELVVVYYAVSQIGAIVSPIPVQYGKHEISEICSVLKANYLLTISEFNDLKLTQQVQEITDSALSNVKVLSFNSTGSGRVSIDTEKQETELLNQHRQSYDDDANNIVTICWTSGTTGTPKGVPRSHNMWFSTAKAEIGPCDFRSADLLLNPFPLVNMAALGGFLFPSALLGSSLVLHHPLDPPLFLKQCQDEKITFTIVPPAMLNQLAKSPDMWNAFDFSALRRIGSGSAPLAPWMIDVFSKEYGKEIINFYGSNEGICLLATEETAPLAEQRASMFPRLGFEGIPWQGEVYEFAKTKIVSLDSGDEITGVGVPGELVINGPTIFDGYFAMDNNSSVFTDDGYFRTGDLVEICGDPPNYYQIVGRCKDIINRGGYKISPSELDQLLEGFEQIKEAAVCAYPDDRLGEKICACLVPTDAQNPPELDEITNYLSEKGVAKYKLPEKIEIFDILPRNPMAKVLRFELQAEVEKRINA